MIDEVGQFPPQPVRDVHWDIGIPSELPYTVASLPFRGTVPETASFGITVPIAEQQIVEETDLDKTQVCIAELSNPRIYAWWINIWHVGWKLLQMSHMNFSILDLKKFETFQIISASKS